MDTSKEEYEIDLFKLLGALWRKAWLIALAALLCGGIAFAYAAFSVTPLYKSRALLYVNNSSISLGSAGLSISAGDLTAAKSLVNTYIVIMNTRTTLEEVISASGVPYTYEDLVEMVTATSVNGTEIFEIEVTSADPQEAELLANTIAQVLPDKISDVVEGSSVRIVDYAVVPTTKASPSITRYTAIGILIGILLSGAFIVIADMRDEQIHGEDYLQQAFAVPVLAVIPELLGSSSSGTYGRDYQSASRQERKK